MSEEVEDVILFLIKGSVVLAHALEIIGISMATMLVVFMIVDEIYEMFTARKSIQKLIMRTIHKRIGSLK